MNHLGKFIQKTIPFYNINLTNQAEYSFSQNCQTATMQTLQTKTIKC